MAARKNRSLAGAHRPFSDLEFALTADKRRVTDLNASDVGDRVELSGRSVEWNAERARADMLRRRCRSLRLTGEKQRDDKNGERENGET